jgi:1-acyl-sn-glycerol-3-phosphate acyltransferase
MGKKRKECTTLQRGLKPFNIFTKKRLFYRCIKPFIRLAMMIFCRKIIINNTDHLRSGGPLLLACNHPNSFLDSIIINSLFSEPVWSLARGDAFSNKFYRKILTALKILPVYRTSEGVANLNENYKTFESCIDIFKDNGIVLIYSEGKCINEWHLRPLRKGTARLAMKAWDEEIPLRVLPVGINYSSFHRFGKNVFLNFGEVITADQFNMEESDGQRHQAFNIRLQQQLERLVFEIPRTDNKQQAEKLSLQPSPARKILLAVPAFVGWLFHLPLFLPIKNFTWKRTHNNDHYDSVMMGLLFLIYPFYLLLCILLIGWVIKSWWVLMLVLLLPFSAWAFVQVKSQLDK